MKALLICITLLYSILLFSCNKSSDQKSEPSSTNEVLGTLSDKEEDQQILVSAQTENEPAQNDSAPAIVKPTPNIDWEKKIIKTASVKLQVIKINEYNDLLHKKIKQFGGYIANEDIFFTDEKSEMIVSIKVPVEEFENLLNDLGGTGIKILERSIKMEDVTGQLVDTKSRLEAKKQIRLKYLEFLKQSKNMSEVLQVQSEINSIQEEIESAISRIQYMSNQAAFSTLNLTFFEPLNGYIPDNNSHSFITKIIDAFKEGGTIIGNTLLLLISVWPLLIILFLGVIIWRRNKTAKKIQQHV